MNYTLITLTIAIVQMKINLDIMVKPEQRIEEVLGILAENGRIFLPPWKKMWIRSWRKGTFVNQHITFKQGNIVDGDILYIKGE